MRVNPMTLSHDESTANTSSNAGTKPAIANQCAPESKSMYFTSEPTKQRSRLSLSRKQRMHWREQNEKQKSVKIDCKRKRGVDAGDNQVDEDALANKQITNSVESKRSSYEHKSPPSKSETTNSDIVCPSANHAPSDVEDAAVSTSDGQTTQIQIIEIDDDDEKDENTNKTTTKPEYFFPEDESAPSLSPRGPTQTLQSADQTNQLSSSSPATQHSSNYPYSHRSSAYIQHIAEACTLIMTDARWRTCNKLSCPCRSMERGAGSSCVGKTLLSWENGDDLSAVKAFITLYDDNEDNSKKHRKVCSSDETDHVFERAMHLYSRMFHRKGPWFDLTDLYTRYYAPKKDTQQSSDMEQEDDGVENCTSEEITETAECDMVNITKEKKQGFFTPRSSGSDTTTSKSCDKSNVSHELIRHKTALELLFTDIRRLFSMGLVRTFTSEYECGFVAGNITAGSKQRGTFLVADERREVLRRLGGGKSPRSFNGGSNRDTNEILSQMQKQQSLFSSCSSNVKLKADRVLLPVQKHVNHVLIEKLACKIAALSSTERSSYKPRKSDINDALQLIKNAWKDTFHDNDSILSKAVLSTLRLREAPLSTLRRLLRLFLCASGGPGAMRGDGTNGWLHVPSANWPEVPNSDWHNVVHPALSSRLGLASFELKHCYTPLPVETEGSSSSPNLSTVVTPMMRVFQHPLLFKLFELGVEIRSFIDRAMEAHELERQNRRRQQATAKEEKRQNHDGSLDSNAPFCEQTVFDQFDVLTLEGRRKFINQMLALCDVQEPNDNSADSLHTLQSTESDIMSLHNDQNDDREEGDCFTTDTERMIVATAIICHRVLQFRMINSSRDLDFLVLRPWLRHCSFDSILAHVLWDCIPLLERQGEYSLTISFLTTILLGSTHVGSEYEYDVVKLIELVKSDIKPYVQFLLPRRNRGKAFERLIIDITHADRAKAKKGGYKKQRRSGDTTTDKLSPIQQLCYSILCTTSTNGSIPFCFLRSLAKRLKAPLPDTMKDVPNHEMELLKIRLCNDNDIMVDVKSSGYYDWKPTTDTSIAISISNGDRSTLGRRCSFEGWETDRRPGEEVDAMRSLTVEELALDEYNRGRLPLDSSLSEAGIEGGFVGWHCEGSHIRAIFRILCLQDLLSCSGHGSDLDEHLTVFLTPYQTSPHDLHVAKQSSPNSTTTNFYERRRTKIESFLDEVNCLDSQSICHSLYDAVRKRFNLYESSRDVVKDEILQRDMAELRSLSCVAAGLGGAALSSIFRCFCYDYRHYCGGLPDLLLVRARYVRNAEESTLVDLGDWIGEGFSKGRILSGLYMLSDDDFLGWSKNGDGLSGSQRRRTSSSRVMEEPFTSLPQNLCLVHNSKEVFVETLFVEVKSASDRLDARQEDWLNILDGVSNARVCKFESKKAPSKQKKKPIKE